MMASNKALQDLKRFTLAVFLVDDLSIAVGNSLFADFCKFGTLHFLIVIYDDVGRLVGWQALEVFDGVVFKFN